MHCGTAACCLAHALAERAARPSPARRRGGVGDREVLALGAKGFAVQLLSQGLDIRPTDAAGLEMTPPTVHHGDHALHLAGCLGRLQAEVGAARHGVGERRLLALLAATELLVAMRTRRG